MFGCSENKRRLRVFFRFVPIALAVVQLKKERSARFVPRIVVQTAQHPCVQAPRASGARGLGFRLCEVEYMSESILQSRTETGASVLPIILTGVMSPFVLLHFILMTNISAKAFRVAFMSIVSSLCSFSLSFPQTFFSWILELASARRPGRLPLRFLHVGFA